MRHIDSDIPLPELPFYSGFRMVAAGNQDLSRYLKDEQGLMLWMLARINPESLLPSPEFSNPQAKSEKEFRRLLSEEWKYLFTSMPTPSAVYYPVGEEVTDPFEEHERMKFTVHELSHEERPKEQSRIF